MRNVYTHYGSEKFDKERWMPIQNEIMCNKPHGGLWAVKNNSTYGWKEWCQENDFRIDKLDTKFEFMLSDDANILELTTPDDLKNIPTKEQPIPGVIDIMFPDFEKMLKSGIDAIQLNLSDGNYELYFPLYGWDCDSILIMNPDIIQTL